MSPGNTHKLMGFIWIEILILQYKCLCFGSYVCYRVYSIKATLFIKLTTGMDMR